MDSKELLNKYLPFIRKNVLPLGLGLFGLIFFVYGLIVLIGSSSSPKDIVFEPGDKKESSQKEIFVDIEGSVVKPGVYRISEESRIQDALIMAGGLSEAADREWVAKNLNLALKIKDGAKIYIPKAGEVLSAQSLSGYQISEGLINVNQASEEELDSLEGVGPSTAAKIIFNRPYSVLEDLVSKKVLTQKAFEKIKGKISIY